MTVNIITGEYTAPTWEIVLGNAGPKWSGHPAFKTVRVKAFTGVAAEEAARLQVPGKGWFVLRSTNIGRGV